MKPIGAPNSPARWLQNNIDKLPADHNFALMEMRDGFPFLVLTGTKAVCTKAVTDDIRQVVCDLRNYRKG